jgi:hypothetical protein
VKQWNLSEKKLALFIITANHREEGLFFGENPAWPLATRRCQQLAIVFDHLGVSFPPLQAWCTPVSHVCAKPHSTPKFACSKDEKVAASLKKSIGRSLPSKNASSALQPMGLQTQKFIRTSWWSANYGKNILNSHLARDISCLRCKASNFQYIKKFQKGGYLVWCLHSQYLNSHQSHIPHLLSRRERPRRDQI